MELPAELPAESIPPSEPMPVEDMPLPEPEMGDEMMPEPEMGDDMMSDMGDEMMPEPEMDGEEVSYRQIQKLVGKLGQKLRTLESSEPLDSQQMKYVLNSIISALDLSKLDEDDREDIMSKFEGIESDMDMGMDGDSELDLGGEEMDNGLDMEEPTETYGIDRVLDELFSESTVDKVLTKYFKEGKIDKTLKKNKMIRENHIKKNKMNEILRLSETYEQEFTAKKFAAENPNYRFIGKTNKGSLVFESNTESYKVTTKGVIS